MINKLIRDGKVAVMYSPGYGAGWSSWAGEHEEFMLFDRDLALMVEGGAENYDIEGYINKQLSEDPPYLGGLRDLVIEWIPVGQNFRIHEYDGSESTVYLDRDKSYTA